MNNRIMAMLLALVAAMFISIVPVKAEAAVANHNHVLVRVREQAATCFEDGMRAHYKCNTCDYKEDLNNVQVTSAQLKIDKATVAHTWEMKSNGDSHWKACSVEGCTATSGTASHTKACIDDKNGTSHSWSCKTEGCGWTVAAEAHVDTDKNCVCDFCDAELEHDWADWGKDATHHWKSCLNTNCTEKHSVAKHDFKATSKKDGVKHTLTCKDCGYTVDENCKDGEDADCKCDTCKYLVKHDQSWARMESVYKDPTCTETGLMSHKKCKDCGLLLKYNSNEVTTLEAVTTQPLGHKAYTTWLKDENGHYHMCQNKGCEEKLEYTAHVPGNYAHDAKQHWAKCSVCDADLEKADHVWEYEQIDGTDTHKIKCTECGLAGTTPRDCADEDKNCFCDACGGLMNHNKSDMEYLCYDATCTESGWYENWLCKTCGTRFDKSYSVIAEEVVFKPATGHALNGKWEQTEDGTEHYQWCANNCATKLHVEGEAAVVGTEAHTHGAWNVGNDAHEDICAVCELTYGYEKHEYTEVELAAASSTGTQRHKLICECGDSVLKKCAFDENCVCKVCGDEMVHEIAALSTVTGKKATCTADGMKLHYKCNTCKNLFSYENGKCTKITQEDTVIPALGHNWVPDGEDVADGRHIMKCSNVVNGVKCNKGTVMSHYTKDGDCYCDVAGCQQIAHSHKHVYVAAVPATCTEAGADAYYYYQDCGKKFDLHEKPITEPAAIPATGHDFGDWTPCEGGIHAKFCANCDEFISEEHIFRNGNVQCATCGGEEELTHVDAVAATCTESGNVEYWYSKVTGKKFADAAGTKLLSDVTVKATNHNMSGWQDAANGSGHKQVCMNAGCNHTLIANHDNVNSCFCTECGGFKTGHAMELVSAVAATCDKEGTQAYFKCSCGKLFDMGYNVIEAPAVIKTVNHDYDNAVVQKDSKTGKHYVACADCGNKVYEEHAMQMSDPNKGNYHQWLCSCGELEIETHYDKNGDNKCDVCGHSTNSTQQTTPVEQHDNKTVYTGSSTTTTTNSWWQNWLEALTPSNSGGSTTTTVAPEANTSAENKTASQSQTSNQSQAAAAPSTNTTTTTNTTSTVAGAVSAEQTNVIVQFITWFLGLFGI